MKLTVAFLLIQLLAFRMQLKLFFPSVTFAKPKSSRNSSIGKKEFNFHMCKYDLLPLKSRLIIKGDVKCCFFREILIAFFSTFVFVEAFAVCENYSPPEGFNPRDLHRLLEKVGSPSGGSDLGKN